MLAQKAAARLGGDVFMSRDAGGVQNWTGKYFTQADGLIYVGAAGIAVRAIAPFIKSKTQDPAVIVMDEGGSFAVPILSGHLGGANDLARELAAATGAEPVITTATDVSGRFAVDEWAKRQHCLVKNPGKIVQVSSGILRGEEIRIQSDWPIAGEAPELVRSIGPVSGKAVNHFPDVIVSMCRYDICTEDNKSDSEGEQGDCGKEQPSPLQLVPQIAVLGVGCRKGTTAEHLETCFRRFLEENRIEEGAVCAAASIDLKKDEPGLLQFCENRKLPLVCCTAEQLLAAEGEFSSSAFVREITGVDNVCERSAVLASEGGGLLVKKTKYDGVTMALAVKPYYPDWRWH